MDMSKSACSEVEKVCLLALIAYIAESLLCVF
jgi:hypothetical protein